MKKEDFLLAIGVIVLSLACFVAGQRTILNQLEAIDHVQYSYEDGYFDGWYERSEL